MRECRAFEVRDSPDRRVVCAVLHATRHERRLQPGFRPPMFSSTHDETHHEYPSGCRCPCCVGPHRCSRRRCCTCHPRSCSSPQCRVYTKGHGIRTCKPHRGVSGTRFGCRPSTLHESGIGNWGDDGKSGYQHSGRDVCAHVQLIVGRAVVQQRD